LVARPILIRDLLLIVLTVSSGAVDAISYLGLERTFSAFMTGNLVFLGLGLVHGAAPEILPVVVALSAFAIGSYLGTRITDSQESSLWPGGVSRALALTAILQLLFLIIWAQAAGQPGDMRVNALLALSGLAMGLQTAAVRSLEVKGIFTTAATFTLVAFMGDLASSRPADEAPRVAGVLIGLVVGAALGAAALLYVRGAAPLLPLLLTVITVSVGTSPCGIRRRTPVRDAADAELQRQSPV
jgi:uncharacterized membrane protein YoaK (UPF0700 family)